MLRFELFNAPFKLSHLSRLFNLSSTLVELALKLQRPTLGGFTRIALLANSFVETRLRDASLLLGEATFVVTRLFRFSLRFLASLIVRLSDFFLKLLLLGRLLLRRLRLHDLIAEIHRAEVNVVQVRARAHVIKVHFTAPV